jgi:hypothetical protein
MAPLQPRRAPIGGVDGSGDFSLAGFSDERKRPPARPAERGVCGTAGAWSSRVVRHDMGPRVPPYDRDFWLRTGPRRPLDRDARRRAGATCTKCPCPLRFRWTDCWSTATPDPGRRVARPRLRPGNPMTTDAATARSPSRAVRRDFAVARGGGSVARGGRGPISGVARGRGAWGAGGYGDGVEA